MNSPTTPKVTVMMMTYNTQAYLNEAIESILNQTYKNFELIIYDDGSTDKTPDIIHSYKDSRIRYIRSEENHGVAYARSHALLLTRGEYVAVQDADDSSYPHRLEKQVDYLDRHRDIVLLGSSYEIINSQGHLVNTIYVPTDLISIRWHLLFGGCFANSSVMFRLDKILEIGGYDEKVLAGADYDLLIRIGAKYKLKQLKEVLVKHRDHSFSLDQVEPSDVKKHYVLSIGRSITGLIGSPVSYGVAECFRGNRQNVSISNLKKAYAITWTCLQTLLEKEIVEGRDRQELFYRYLKTLFKLVERYNMLQEKALILGLRGGIFCFPIGLFSLKFAHFLYKVSLSKRIRNKINNNKIIRMFLRRKFIPGYIVKNRKTS